MCDDYEPKYKCCGIRLLTRLLPLLGQNELQRGLGGVFAESLSHAAYYRGTDVTELQVMHLALLAIGELYPHIYKGQDVDITSNNSLHHQYQVIYENALVTGLVYGSDNIRFRELFCIDSHMMVGKLGHLTGLFSKAGIESWCAECICSSRV